ncbi:hypothetical protein [Pectinatus frisingensis]|jgi:hypothetical protein|uniref:hypothetical protein n=1 Tax=Pectinatus frisingensis TaxID=865 RepID=UPI0018C6BE6C|nr:hypothetical protein [Pectinatus frisingensis]
MKGWTADFTNDALNDFELAVEILYNDEDVAVIRKGENGLEIKWYANQNQLIVPLDWLAELLAEAKKQMK